MQFWTRPYAFLPSILALVLLSSGSSAVFAQGDVISPMRDLGNCQAVHAMAEPRVVVDCPADQGFDFCMTRELIDKAGVITGRLEYFEDSSMGAEISHTPNEILYSSSARIVTDEGKLEMAENGIFDMQSKEWAGLATLTGGSGIFEGATGKLATFGNAEAMGMFIGTVCAE